MPDPVPTQFRPPPDGLDLTAFHALIRRLRDPERGCPWDSSRTLSDMAKPLTDEAAEAAEALAAGAEGSAAHQAEELGDVFLNVMLAAVIAEEAGRFTWGTVVRGVTEKLIRRHPHVFAGVRAGTPEEAMRLFLEAKAREKEEKTGEAGGSE